MYELWFLPRPGSYRKVADGFKTPISAMSDAMSSRKPGWYLITDKDGNTISKIRVGKKAAAAVALGWTYLPRLMDRNAA